MLWQNSLWTDQSQKGNRHLSQRNRFVVNRRGRVPTDLIDRAGRERQGRHGTKPHNFLTRRLVMPHGLPIGRALGAREALQQAHCLKEIKAVASLKNRDQRRGFSPALVGQVHITPWLILCSHVATSFEKELIDV